MFNRPIHVIVAGLAAIGVAPVANAQTAPSTAGQARPVSRTDFIRDLDANYKRVDANGDGSVTPPELVTAQARSEQAIDAMMVKRRAEMFTKFDTNKDGQLSVAEFNAATPIPQRPKADPAQALAQLDSNKDQKVSATEFRAPALANFDKLDLNRDGTISLDEQQKARTAAK